MTDDLQAGRNRLRPALWVLVVAAVGVGGWQVIKLLPRPGGGLSEDQIARLQDPSTRAAAAREAGRERIAEALPYLETMLSVEQAEDRAAAAWALAQIGGDRAERLLLRKLDDPAAAVRAAVAWGLAHSGYDPSDPEYRRLLTDETIEVRAAAVEAIQPVDPRRWPERPDLAAVREAIEHTDSRLRLAAVRATANLDSRTAFEVLSWALADTDPEVRREAQRLAGQRSNDLTVAAMGVLRSANDPAQRLGAARMLGRIGTADTARSLLAVLDGMDSDDAPEAFASARELVVEALAGMGPDVLDVIIEAAAEGELTLAAERAAAEVCVRIGPEAGPAIAEAILAWKIFPDPRELRIWVEALGKVGDAAAMPALSRALAQDVEGMETLVAEAHKRICRREGRSLPAPAPETGLLADPPGPTAYQPLRRGAVPVTPYKPGPGPVPDDGVVRLTLAGGLTWSDKPGRSGRFDLEIELLRHDGQWQERFFANCISFSKRAHEGRLISAQSRAGTTELQVEVAFDNDLWRAAAFGRYTIELVRKDGLLTAKYRGYCNEEPVSGPVEVATWPIAWRDPGVPELAPGEHPRLLLRPMDLESVRSRARTPFGRRVLAALRSRLAWQKKLYRTELKYVTNWQPGIDAAIGHGFLAALFDDQAHGRRAVQLVLPRTFTAPYRGEHGERWPEPLARYPFAFDLAYNWFSPQERQKVLRSRCHMSMEFSRRAGPLGVFAVTRGVYSVPGTTALALLKEQGPSWVRPPKKPDPVVDLPAQQDLPTEGVPVMSFRPGQPLSDWLIAGPMHGPRQGLAGLAEQIRQRHFQTGDALALPGGGKMTFRPLPDDAVRGLEDLPTNQKFLFIPEASQDDWTVLYAVLRAKKTTCFRLPTGTKFASRDSRIWIDGRQINFATVVALAPGLHRIAMEVRGNVILPYFHDYRLGFARASWLRYAWEEDKWQAEREVHHTTGQMSDMPYILERCIVGTRISLRRGLSGPRGKAKKRGEFGGSIQWPFISALWIATGRGLWPDTPIILAEGNEQASPRNVSDRMLCFSMGLAPEPVRTQLAREFDRRFAGDRIHRLDCLELIGALVNYPIPSGDTATRPPADR